MKKVLFLVGFVFCLMLTGCSDGSESKDTEEEKVNTMIVETQYGDLFYPQQYQDFVSVDEKIEGENLTITFKTTIEDIEYPLFDIMINEEEGDSVGTLEDDHGKVRNVYVEIINTDVPELSEDDQNQIYAMQEGVNVLVDHLNDE